MKIHNLIGQSGNFETSCSGQAPGVRTFGFWSFREPAVGDLVVKPKTDDPTTKTLWQIQHARCSFTGSDGNRWWEGVMKDVTHHKLLTQEMIDLLQQAGLD